MFLIAMTLAMAAPPDRWIPIGGSAGQYEEYLDTGSVKRTRAKVTLWTRRDFALRRSTWWNELEIDCSAKTHTLLAYVRDDDGTVSHNSVRPHRAAAPIAPKSTEERVFEQVCRNRIRVPVSKKNAGS